MPLRLCVEQHRECNLKPCEKCRISEATHRPTDLESAFNQIPVHTEIKKHGARIYILKYILFYYNYFLFISPLYCCLGHYF